MNALFKHAPRDLTEHEAALWREQSFQRQYATLVTHWNERLIQSGLLKEEVLFDHKQSNHIARDYRPETEQFFIDCRRFYWVGDFKTRHGSEMQNKNIWKMYCDGLTSGEISERTHIYRRKVSRIIETITKRVRAAALSGQLNARDDSPAEKEPWDRKVRAALANKERILSMRRSLQEHKKRMERCFTALPLFENITYPEELERTIHTFERLRLARDK